MLCSFSTVVDTVTDYNMTDKEYIEMCAEKDRKEAREIIKSHTKPFEEVKDCFIDNNMTQEEFNRILLEMGSSI